MRCERFGGWGWVGGWREWLMFRGGGGGRVTSLGRGLGLVGGRGRGL